MTRKISCLVGRHAWSSVYDPEKHQTNRTCRNCRKTRVLLIDGNTRLMDSSGPSAMQGGPGIGL